MGLMTQLDFYWHPSLQRYRFVRQGLPGKIVCFELALLLQISVGEP